MQDFHSKLQDTLRAALDAAQSLPPGPEAGYWSFRRNPAPPAIRSPDDFGGGERLCIASTQTNLPPRAQKQLVARWCQFLPTLEGVRYIWFTSKVSQELFEAACKVRDLEGLYVKWSSINSVTSLSAARALRYLHIGSSPAITDLTPVSKLVHLVWLELDNLKTISDLTPLQVLSKLEGLGFTGAEGRHHMVLSFAPLAKLSHLRWLHLGSIHAQDNSLRALGALKKLRWLGVGNFFPWQEFAWLAAQLPDAICPWFAPGDDLGRIRNQVQALRQWHHAFEWERIRQALPCLWRREILGFFSKVSHPRRRNARRWRLTIRSSERLRVGCAKIVRIAAAAAQLKR